jgi:hypothetical protein
VAFFAELLQHQCRVPMLKPAPAKLALVNPFLRHHETKAINIEAQRGLDTRNPEEWHRLLNVGVCFSLGFHTIPLFCGSGHLVNCQNCQECQKSPKLKSATTMLLQMAFGNLWQFWQFWQS